MVNYTDSRFIYLPSSKDGGTKTSRAKNSGSNARFENYRKRYYAPYFARLHFQHLQNFVKDYCWPEDSLHNPPHTHRKRGRVLNIIYSCPNHSQSIYSSTTCMILNSHKFSIHPTGKKFYSSVVGSLKLFISGRAVPMTP